MEHVLTIENMKSHALMTMYTRYEYHLSFDGIERLSESKPGGQFHGHRHISVVVCLSMLAEESSMESQYTND